MIKPNERRGRNRNGRINFPQFEKHAMRFSLFHVEKTEESLPALRVHVIVSTTNFSNNRMLS